MKFFNWFVFWLNGLFELVKTMNQNDNMIKIN